MRDDVFPPLTRAQRREVVAGWRAIPWSTRLETGRLAEKGLPAPDPAVSAAARRHGEYLLRKEAINRLPRSALTMTGLALLAAGLFLLSTDWTATPVPAMCIAGGVAGAAMGLLSWGQRRAGRLLVAANASAVSTP